MSAIITCMLYSAILDYAASAPVNAYPCPPCLINITIINDYIISNYLIDKGIVCEKTDYYSFSSIRTHR